MPQSTQNEDQPKPVQSYGCFWLCGWFGALMIGVLLVGELRGIGFDGPFGGIFWIMAQGFCLLVCTMETIRCVFDKSRTTSQRKRMWMLTLFPPAVIVMMIIWNELWGEI